MLNRSESSAFESLIPDDAQYYLDALCLSWDSDSQHTMTPKSQVPEPELLKVHERREQWRQEWAESDSDPVALRSAALRAVRDAEKTLASNTGPAALKEPLSTLESLAMATDVIERLMQDLVAECRRRSYSWADIAVALGVARQSAWTKYSSVEEDSGRSPWSDLRDVIRDEVRSSVRETVAQMKQQRRQR